jgi:hypothetical protein
MVRQMVLLRSRCSRKQAASSQHSLRESGYFLGFLRGFFGGYKLAMINR